MSTGMWRAEQSSGHLWVTHPQITLSLLFQMIEMNLHFNLNQCVNRRCGSSWRLTEPSAERFFSTRSCGRRTWSGWIGWFQRDLLPRMDFYMQSYNIGRLHFHALLYSWANKTSECQHLLAHHEDCVAKASALCEENVIKQLNCKLLTGKYRW